MSARGGIIVVGLSHRTAPVSVRERVAVPEGKVEAALAELGKLEALANVCVLSTCNRVEIWAEARVDPAAALESARAFLCSGDPKISDHLYLHRDVEAVRHLFRVASSLDSMVLGEPQILGQVKEAFAAAEQAKSTGGLLGRVCRKAFAVAKRVRTETGVGRNAVSMSYAAVELAKKVLGGLDGHVVLLVGAGKMSALAAKLFVQHGADRVLVTNRTAARAETLAAEVGGAARPWDQLGALLQEADVVVCSTAAPHAVITEALVKEARKHRHGRPLFFVDLAVPRDVEPKINDLDGCYVYDVDDLEQVLEENKQVRAQEAARAEALVQSEAEGFLAAAKGEAQGLVRKLRQHGDGIAKAELEKTMHKLGAELTDAQRKALGALASAIVNKLLHAPTSRLRKAAEEDDGRVLFAAAELFGLAVEEPQEPDDEARLDDAPDKHATGEAPREARGDGP